MTASDHERLRHGYRLASSVLRIIDRTPDRPAPVWGDAKAGQIGLDPRPILYEPGPFGEEVTVGLALHNAAHHQMDSAARWAAVRGLYPARVAAFLTHIGEDARVEAPVRKTWPGFTRYLRAAATYVGASLTDSNLGETALGKGLEGAWKLGHGLDDKTLTSADRAFWGNWLLDYLAVPDDDVRAVVQAGLDYLGLDPETATQMDSAVEAEHQSEKAGDTWDRMAQQTAACVTTIASAPVASAALKIAANSVEVGEARFATESEVIVISDGDREYTAVVNRPKIPDAIRPLPPDLGLVESLRAVFAFRRAVAEHDLKLQRSGRLDDEELWRLATRDYRVFSEHEIESRPDTALGFLLDLSGSMAGAPTQAVHRVMAAVLEAIKDLPGLRRWVWAHSTITFTHQPALYRVVEPDEGPERLDAITGIVQGDNYDSVALRWCVSQLLAQPETQRALIVLSDGLPNGYLYGGPTAERAVRRVVDEAEDRGIEIIQVAIAKTLRSESQAAMYRRWVAYRSDAELPGDLAWLVSHWA